MEAPAQLAEVFTADELAQAAGVGTAEVEALMEAGAIATVATPGRVRFVPADEAVRAGRALAAGLPLVWTPTAPPAEPLTSPSPSARNGVKTPFFVSTALHSGLVAILVAATAWGVSATRHASPMNSTDLRLVYLALPGPGGGGGGGGAHNVTPAPVARKKGSSRLNSPVPPRPAPPTPAPPTPEEVTPPPPKAPVASAPADPTDQDGVVAPAATSGDSRGPGDDAGAGAGHGNGTGDGTGSGIGDGTDGGTGGGPYRPGSGVEPPTLLQEVKPDYSEEARRRGVSGDVLMTLVVRRDGSVADVHVTRGLGYGLDERAVEAVRQWRFAPGRHRGTPVDVQVEVAIEFRLR